MEGGRKGRKKGGGEKGGREEERGESEGRSTCRKGEKEMNGKNRCEGNCAWYGLIWNVRTNFKRKGV